MIIRNYLFHRVLRGYDRLAAVNAVEIFEKAVKYISERYNVVNLESFYLNPVKKESEKPYACITFDDGFKDNVGYAAPILKKYKCPASFYIVTDCIDNGTLPWPQYIDYLFENTKKTYVNIDCDCVPSHLRNGKWKDNEARRVYYKYYFRPILRSLKTQDVNRLLFKLSECFDDVKVPLDKMMNWDDIISLRKHGFTIGSHTKTHALLANEHDRAVIIKELYGSGEVIKHRLGEWPLAISYPANSYNDTVVEEAANCGYKLGLVVGQRFYDPSKDDIFRIPRMDLYEDNWIKTKFRITGILEAIKRFIKK